jgi:hypothetical protein
MLVKLILIWSAFVLLLNGCASVQIPNTRVCSPAGSVASGGFCNYTIQGEPEDLSFEAFIAFLEADEVTGKGAAMCQSSADWARQKSALEQACRKLGSSCTYEMKTAFRKVSRRVESVIGRSNSQKGLVHEGY